MFGLLIEEDVTVGCTTTTTRYAYDGWNPAKAGATGTSNFDVWAVLNGSSSLTSRQLQGDGIDQHLAYVQSSNAYWYLTDHLGSTRAVIDNSGTVQDSIAHDAYGNITYQMPSPSTTPLYAWDGYDFDAATKMYDDKARVYDPASGRWITQDPMGFDAGDSNLYRYVNNRPTVATDPSGFLECDDRPSQPLNKQLIDSRAKVEEIINKIIQGVAKETFKAKDNSVGKFLRNIFNALGADQPDTGVKLTGGVWDGKVFSNLARVAVILMRDLDWSKKQIVRIPFLESRYGGNLVEMIRTPANSASWYDPAGVLIQGLRGAATIAAAGIGVLPPARFNMATANHMIAPNIRIDQNGQAVIIGLDKLEHFFQQGFWYFTFQKQTRWADDPRTRRQFGNFMEGFSYNTTLKSEFERVSRQFYPGFNEGTFGIASTGIASRADTNANEDGYQFYVSIGKAYGDWVDGGGKGDFPGRFFFASYNVKQWSEFLVGGNLYRGTFTNDS